MDRRLLLAQLSEPTPVMGQAGPVHGVSRDQAADGSLFPDTPERFLLVDQPLPHGHDLEPLLVAPCADTS